MITFKSTNGKITAISGIHYVSADGSIKEIVALKKKTNDGKVQVLWTKAD